MIKLYLFIIILSISVTTSAHPPGDYERSVTNVNNESYRTSLTVPDVIVQDSLGNEGPLLKILGNNIAVVNFIFTTCTTICPVLGATMQELQKRLNHRLGRDVVMLSITVDPLRDTPERLRAYADKFGAQQNWYWLTGRPSDINQILKAFGIPTGRSEDHPPVIFSGNVQSGYWFRWVGLPSSEMIIANIDQLSIHLTDTK